MCVCCVAETRHTYPRLERKPAAIPEWDGKCYIIRVPDPAVHSLVPEPYLLRPGLARPLQGRPAGFRGFVCLIYFHGKAFFFFFFLPIATGHWLFMQHCFFLLLLFTCWCWLFASLMWLFYCSVVGLVQILLAVLTLQHRYEMSEMFVTCVQTCVSLLNEQMENIVISIKRLPSLITPVQWKF